MFVYIVCALFALYFYLTKNNDYWKQRNVKHDDPIPLFGTNFKNYFGKKSWTETSIEQYNKYPNEKVVGYYRGRKPELIIRDPDLIRQILNVDFLNFYPRGLGRDPETEPLLLNLFHADGDRWRLLRQRLTPAFTSGKLKAMFPLIVNCAKKLQIVTEEIASKNEEYDVRELMARFTTDFIGACGFGIEMDSINNERSMFRDLGREIFNVSPRAIIVLVLKDLFPNIITRKLKPSDNGTVDSINDILKKIVEQRNFKPSGRNDFIDMLLDLRQKGKITAESIEKINPDGTPTIAEMEMDFKMMAAQLFVFFAAGFETSSSATSYTLHQLAYHPDVQKKLHEEIDQVLAKHNNTLSYEAVKEMHYLDRTFKEALRMFPSLGVLNRDCARKYTIPDLNITIDPGVKIVIPIMALHNDEKYFENPHVFDPDRFLDDNMKNKHKYVYLPFGEGPRACIGPQTLEVYPEGWLRFLVELQGLCVVQRARLGQMQSLAGLAAVLQKFRVEPSESTIRNPTVKHRSNVVQNILGGLPLHIIKRESTL